jgi:hypothetical protein
VKITWRVDPPPSGKWRSFELRSWPSASFENGKPAAMIYCGTEYIPTKVKSGDHDSLTVKLFHHNHPERGNSWKIFTLRIRPKTLAEAKELVKEFYNTHPDWIPK